MRVITFLIAILFSGSIMAQTNNSLINTSWKGSVNIPSPTDVEFSFLKDTISVYAGGQVVEVMSYVKKSDTLYIHKIYGASPCDNEGLLVWKVTVKADELTIKTVSDECPRRSSNIGEDTYFTRIKPKVE